MSTSISPRALGKGILGLFVALATVFSTLVALPATAAVPEGAPRTPAGAYQFDDPSAPNTISGYVTDSSGNGIANVLVQTIDPNEYVTLDGELTDEFGYFTITPHLGAGDYKMQFWANGGTDFLGFFGDPGSTFETADIVTVSDSVGVGLEWIVTLTIANIEGYVYDDAGDPLEGVTVELYDSNDDLVDMGVSDVDGYYFINDLAAGTYTTCYSLPGYVSTCYGDAPNTGSANTFELIDDATAFPLDDVFLARAGGISGTVWPSHVSVTGLSGITVSAYQFEGWSWTRVDSVDTDADGNYEFGALGEGTYRVAADAENSLVPEYQPEWYPNSTRVSLAESVEVVAGETTSGIDFELDLGGSIAVAAYCDDIGSPCVGASVTLEALDGTLPDEVRTTTDSVHTFDGLPDGRYLVRFTRDGQTDFYWGGDGSRETAEAVTIAGGSDVTGIFYVYNQNPASNTVTGSVDIEDGSLLTVYLLGEGLESWESSRVIDSVEVTGTPEVENFSFTVPAGRYTLQFGEDFVFSEDGDEISGYASYWGGAYRIQRATWFDVAQGDDLTLSEFSFPDRSVTISGVIRNNAATPVGQADVLVTLSSVNGTATTMTGPGGTYSVSGLAPGLYALNMSKPGLATTWNQSVRSRPSVNASNASGSYTLNGTMAIAGAAIRGRVTGGGNGISDGSVFMIARRGSDNCPVAVSEVDESGNYAITGLVAGTYTVTASTTYTFSCNDGGAGNSSADANWQNQSRAITVTANQNLTGQNFAMVAGGIIRGSVTVPDGTDLSSGLQVGIYGTNNEFVAYADVADDGTFEVLGLVAGSYHAKLWETTTSAPQWWTGGTANRGIINVTAGSATTGINFDGVAGGTLTGRIVSPNGSGVVGYLQAFDRFGAEVGFYDFSDPTNGVYSVYSLPEGPIRLRLTVGSASFWVGGGSSLATAAVHYVSPGGTTNAPALTVARPASITGEVGVAGSTEPGIVTLIDSTGREADSAYVQSGRYAFSNVAAGLYTIRFQANSGELVWYGNRDSLATATYINVTAGAVLENIDLNATAATAAFVPGAVSTTGTLRVGQTMTVTPGTWTPAPTAIQYRWYVEWSGAPVSTTASYVVKPEDQGKFLRLQMIVSKAGVTSDVVEIDFGRVMGLAFTTAPVPTITPAAAPKPGTLLTAAPGTWSPAVGAITYQWYRGSNPILGATSSTYTATVDDIGARLSVRTVGTKPGYLGVGKSSVQLPVTVANTLTASPVPTVTVTGTKQPGGVLTAVPGTWTPAPVGLTYEWRRGGVAIPGATSPTYTLTSEDVSASITVAVTGGKAGFTSITRVSAAVTGITALNTRLSGSTPTISGTARVGNTLTANAGTWTDGAALSYQWVRNGVHIVGATGSTYVVTPGDLGATIRVQVTGTKDLFSPLRKLSAPTATVGQGTISTDNVEFSIDGTFIQGDTLTALSSEWPVSVSLTYQWLRDGVEIKGATKRTYVTSSRDRDKYITVRVTATAKGYSSVVVLFSDLDIGGYTSIAP